MRMESEYPFGLLSKLLLINAPVPVAEYVENDPLHLARMGGDPFCHGLNRNLGRPFFREAEHAGGDAAECHTSQVVFRTEVERIPVTVSQIVLQVRGKSVVHNRPNDVHDFFRRKIISVRQHRHCGRLLIIPPVAGTKRLHLLMAFGAQLDTRIGVNTVCDTLLNHTARHCETRHR